MTAAVVRIVFGSDLDREGDVEVEARTLGEALDQLDGTDGEDLRVFVDGVDADRLEGSNTPVGDEDRILLTTW